jgi:mannose-6-phosphate isomerase-like protein (cupin superfamily)
MSDQNFSFRTEYRETNWGFDTVLSDAGHYKVKELIIKPGQRISLQSHEHRTEHWLILEGQAVVTIGDKPDEVLEIGDTQIVPARTVHRIANELEEPLVILEAQFLVGKELSEEDIVRYHDDYGRPTVHLEE